MLVVLQSMETALKKASIISSNGINTHLLKS